MNLDCATTCTRLASLAIALVAGPLVADLASQVPVADATGMRRFEFVSANIGFWRLADIDGDARLEGIGTAGSSLRIVDFGPDPGAWLESSVVPSGSPTSGVNHFHVGEVHGDGHDDLIEWQWNVLSVLSGIEGLAEHHWISAPVFIQPQVVASGDLDGDGLTDVLEASPLNSQTTWTVHVARANGLGDWQTTQTYPHEALVSIGSLDLADLDGDGLLDVVTADGSSTTTHLALGAAGATFGAPFELLPAEGNELVRHQAALDVDLDGDLDLVQQRYPLSCAGSKLALFLNDGAAQFAPGPVTPMGTCAFDMTSSDLDGDGTGELLVSTGSTVELWDFAPGTAAATTRTVPIGSARFLQVGDLDCDGIVDLSCESADDAAVALGLPALQFPAPVTLTVGEPSSDRPFEFLAADMGGDGHLDLVELDPRLGEEELVIHGGSGDGTFVLGASISSGPFARKVVVGEIDGDGLMDAVIGAGKLGVFGTDAGWIRLALGNGPDTLASYQEHGVAHSVDSVELGDLDGDGDLDCVTSGVSVLLFEGGTFLPVQDHGSQRGVGLGDFDGDGDLDVLSGGGYLLIGDGQGGLLPWPWWIGVDGFRATDMEVIDLDHDGDLDALGIWTDGLDFSYAEVARNHGAGNLTTTHLGWVGDSIKSFSVADVDGDGASDLLVPGGSSSSKLELWRGDGQGGFGVGSFTGGLPDMGVHAQGDMVVEDIDADGDLDILFPYGEDLRTLSLRTPYLLPMSDLGSAKAGKLGSPVLKAYGSLQPGSGFRLSLCNARPLANSHLVWGLSQLDTPFKGGVLVPLPAAILMGIPIDPDGSMVGLFDWPIDIPSGFELFLQFWIEDPAAWLGLSASNGLRMVAP
jgi:hypothetical protein